MILSTGTHLGPYEILGPIGEGGMGVVYRALDPRLGRQVAIKLLPHGLAANPDAQERLRFEAIAAAALDHPYICKIYEVGEHEGDVYLVMEYIAGETLRQRLSGGKMPLTETLRIAAEITDALEAAHAGGILHRDLKPANIMLTQQGHVKIMDFGLAKRMASLSGADASMTQLTMPGAILGTPAYMSPEQVKGQPLDARSDLFSFGVILAEMASGVSPFQRPSMAETMTAVLHDPPHLSRDLPPATTAVLERLLAKAPEDRYGSAGELRRQLSGLATAPITPPPVSAATWAPVNVPQISLGAPPVASQPMIVQPPPMQPMAALSRRARRQLEKNLKRTGERRSRLPWVLVPLFFIFFPSISKTLRNEFGWLLPGSSKTAANEGPAPAAKTLRSIAVLPLENHSGDPSQDYFAEGMTDELTSDLATISQLRVIARGSVMQFRGDHRPPTPEIAKALHVDAILEGSVRRSGDTVRITAQLIDARADKDLWSKSFERKSSDVLVLQDDLASAIASEINVQLSPSEKTRLASAPSVNLKAHDAYLKGRYFFDRPSDENLKKSIGLFEQAVRLSPDFAPAWSGLSDAYLWAGYNEDVMTAAEAKPKARAAAEKAIAFDSESAEAHTSLAVYKFFYDFDWDGSEVEFKKAIALNPSYAFAHDQFGLSLALQGRLEESEAEGNRAAQLDPLSPQIQVDKLLALALAGDYDEARDAVDRAEELDPTFFFSHWGAAWIDLQQGKIADSIAELQKSKSMGAPTFVSAWLGYAYGASGDRTRALAEIDELKKTSSHGRVLPFNLALIYLGMGDKQRALDYLEQAKASDSQWMGWLKEDKVFAPLHAEPRYLALMKQLNLTR